MTGWGLGRNIRRLYGELARVYDPGDDIYLFGFSRGAFTVRMLARMIDTCGILAVKGTGLTRKDVDAAIKKIYRDFLNSPSIPVKAQCNEKALDTSHKDRAQLQPVPATVQRHEGVRIKFIGVWDTVDAVGLPTIGDIVNEFWRFKAIDCDVLGNVEHVCHALAIDDERAAFAPLLWKEKEFTACEKAKIEQVWFAGAHSNVGGGYPRQGMSLVALDWMMSRAAEHGLRFTYAQCLDYQCRQSASDRLYDPRSGIWILYRWKPRDIGQICEENGIIKPRIHISVFERLALRPEGYAPPNLPTSFEVVSTHASQQAAAIECAKGVQDEYTQSILGTHKVALFVGKASYLLVIIGLFLSLLAVIGWLTGFFGSLSFKWFAWGIFGSLGLAYVLAYFTDLSLELGSIKFWDKPDGIQSKLQKIFGLAPSKS